MPLAHGAIVTRTFCPRPDYARCYERVGEAAQWLCRSIGFSVRFYYGPSDAPVGVFLKSVTEMRFA